MTRRRIDWKLLIVLVGAGTIFLVAVRLLHRWRRSFQPPQETATVMSAIE